MKHLKSIAQKAGKIMSIILVILLAVILILAGVLLACSPGKPKQFLDETGMELPDSIAEKIHVNINGVEQGMFIKGKDKTNPVLLFLHGGPGMPEYFLTEEVPTGLEDEFTVCYWDQRGAGLSYNSDMLPETITVEQLVSDTNEVSNYLRERFGQDKIYLMGHSWGSFLGIQAAASAPELYLAYIGMGQMSKQMESEKLTYEYALRKFKEAGNNKMVKKLEAFTITAEGNLPDAYLNSFLRGDVMHILGVGTMRNMKSVVSGIFLPVMQSRAYTFSEKINIWRAKFVLANSTELHNRFNTADLTADVPELQIPTYFISGKYDYNVSQALAKDYLHQLQAPIKGFYTFDESAHSPLFEEPEKFMQIMREDVLAGTTALADSE